MSAAGLSDPVATIWTRPVPPGWVSVGYGRWARMGTREIAARLQRPNVESQVEIQAAREARTCCPTCGAHRWAGQQGRCPRPYSPTDNYAGPCPAGLGATP